MAELTSSPVAVVARSHAMAAPFLARKLRAVDAELGAAIPRVLAKADEEAIHDLRVAIRRLRTLLKLARPVFGRFHADAVRAAFTLVHRATGALRDEEVLEGTLAAVACEAPAFAAWRARRAARERSLRRAMIARLQAGELSRARKLLHALVTLPVKPAKDAPAARLARKAIARARKSVEAQRDTPTSDVLGLHALRIAYKELRYTAELLAGALPADLAAMADPAARFQKRLGEVHDVDVAVATVKRARGFEPMVQAEVLALLEAMRDRKIAKYTAEMTPMTPVEESAPAPAKTPPKTPAKAPSRAPSRLAAVASTTSASSRSGRSRAS